MKSPHPSLTVTPKIPSRLAAIVASFVAAVVLFSGIASADSPEVFVQVRESKVRTEPKPWAAAVSNVAYGDALRQLSTEGAWVKVKTKGGKEGFIHSSALTSRKVVLSSRAGVAAGADRDDVVLAGKGFNREVEQQFKGANPTANFRAVDDMERLRVSDGELRGFISSGKLQQGGSL